MSRGPAEGALIIRPPMTAEEYDRACAFTTERYRAAGYLTTGAPLQHPQALLLAVRGTSLIGSLGIECAEDALLPTERAFGFRCEELAGLPRSRIFECTRVAVERGVGLVAATALLTASVFYSARRYDGQFWLFTVTAQHEHFMQRQCHMRTRRLPFAIADPSLPRDYPAYWAADPPPYPICLDRTALDAALARVLPVLRSTVRFDLTSFDHRHNQATDQVPASR